QSEIIIALVFYSRFALNWVTTRHCHLSSLPCLWPRRVRFAFVVLIHKTCRYIPACDESHRNISARFVVIPDVLVVSFTVKLSRARAIIRGGNGSAPCSRQSFASNVAPSDN